MHPPYVDESREAPGEVFCFFFSKKKRFLQLAFQDLTP